MSNSQTKEKKYDLEERTAKLGEDIIKFAKTVPKSAITNSLISQLVKAGTSIGANYNEADCAESRKDFVHKLSISKKEAKETKYWLRMFATVDPAFKGDTTILWKEANELQLIFRAIINKTKENEGKIK